MQFNDDLEEETDVLAGEMQTLDNLPLEKFVFSDDQLPSIKLTRDKADNIDTGGERSLYCKTWREHRSLASKHHHVGKSYNYGRETDVKCLKGNLL